MWRHTEITPGALRMYIRNGRVLLAGNRQLKIYGQLRCASGKRMKRENRVFFASVEEAREAGFRPCGHCMKAEYIKWKNGPLRK
ncbi:MAG: metal-binding protein [Bacteroidia bacterium]|nr:metal-binding protein [Bacteroidia bacterium]